MTKMVSKGFGPLWGGNRQSKQIWVTPPGGNDRFWLGKLRVLRITENIWGQKSCGPCNPQFKIEKSIFKLALPKWSNFAQKQSHFLFWLFSERIWNHHFRFWRCYFAHSKPNFALILDNDHQEMPKFLLGGAFFYVRWHLCYFFILRILLLPSPCSQCMPTYNCTNNNKRVISRIS